MTVSNSLNAVCKVPRFSFHQIWRFCWQNQIHPALVPSFYFPYYNTYIIPGFFYLGWLSSLLKRLNKLFRIFLPPPLYLYFFIFIVLQVRCRTYKWFLSQHHLNRTEVIWIWTVSRHPARPHCKFVDRL